MTYRTLRMIGLSMATATSAFAGGMQIPFQTGTSLGIAFADTPLLIDQAAATFYNPAVLTTLKHPQVQVGGNLALPSIRFSGTYQIMIPFFHTPTEPFVVHNAEGGYAGFIPNLYFATPVNDRVAIGIGLVSNYGLGLAFNPKNAIHDALKNDQIMNLDLTPSFGFKINSAVSIGLGLDLQYLENTNTLDLAISGQTKPIDIGSSKDYLNGFSLGYHVGLMINLNKENQAALTFHSHSTYHLTGYSAYTPPAPNTSPPQTNRHFSSDWHLPWWISAGIRHRYSARWYGLAKLQYTGWSTLQSITVHNTAVPPIAPPEPIVVTPLHLSNSWTVVLGTTYELTLQSQLQLGIAWDQGASNPTYRQIWLPDNDHYSIAVGWRYQWSRKTILNIGYDFAYMASAAVRNPTPKGHVNPIFANGELKSTSSVIGLELTHNFN